MAISQAELKLYKAAQNSDTPASNGGRMSATEVVSGLAANVFPRTTNAERIAGSTKHRKVFYKAAAADDSALVNTRVYLENYTPGDDTFVMFLGTQTNTESDLTGSERKYAVGQLNATVSGGATQVVVDFETGAGAESVVQIGDYIRISDKADPDSAGNEEIVLVSNVGWATDTATIDFSPALSAGYSSTNTRVASLLDVDAALGDVVPTYANFDDTGAGGTFDDVNHLILDSIGTIEQTWTLTFTSGSAFSITGDTLGVLGTGGNTTGGASPNNPDFGEPYFTMNSAGFSGTFATNDVITFQTSPGAVPIWLKRVVPAGAASASNNQAVIAIDGESA